MFKTIIKRITILSILVCVMLIAIEGKLFYSTLMIHDELLTKINDQQTRSFPLKSPRGMIYDINVKPLLQNRPCFSLYAIPYQVKDKEYTAKVLAKYIKMPENEILEKLSSKTSIVSFKKDASILDFDLTSKIQKEKLDGIYCISSYKRQYPYSPYMSSLLGFVGSDLQGLSGLEVKYDDYLKGKNGSLNYYLDAKGGLLGIKSEIKAPIKGFDLQLTLDLNIQNIVERELDYAYLTYNADEVSCICMDPNTGKILAIGNRPTYDNNNYQDYPSDIYNRLLPINNSFEPGSTFKSVSFAAAIEENKIDIFNDTYYDKGYEIVSGTRIKSWKKGGHGLQTFLDVLINSSNPGFVEIARRLGKDKIYEYVDKFGFREKTGVDIAGENKGIFFDYDKFNELEQATTCFGQGISVTAIQLVTAFSSLINGGKLYQPYIVNSIINPTLEEPIQINNPIMKRRVISEKTSSLMRYSLESVVAKGTGRKAYVEGYRVGGKTGTGQIAENGHYVDGKYLLSFIGGAPMDNPKMVCYFSIKNAKNTVQYGGTTVGPIVGRIIHDSLRSINEPYHQSEIEREYTWMDLKTHPVENYIGKSKKSLYSPYFTFVIKGNGDKVIDQLPRVGTLLEEKSTILVYMG